MSFALKGMVGMAGSQVARPAGGPRDMDVASVPPVSRRARWITLLASCLALFTIFLDNTIVNVAVPAIQHDLGAAVDQLEWTVNAYVVTFAGFVLLAGKLGDRFGRRRLFAAGLLVFAVASAAGALASTSGVLIAARAAQGLGAALLAPLSLSLLATVFGAQELPTVIGVWAGVSGVGLAVGPLAGGLLVEHSSWHAVFWVNVPIALLAALLTLAGVPESRQSERQPIDLPGALLVTGGLVSAVAGLARAVRHPWGDRWTLTLLVAGGVLLAGFAVQQLRSAAPLVPVRWLRERAVLTASAALALASFGLFGAIYLISLYLQNVRGYTAVEAGVRMLPLTVSTLVIAPLAGRLAARRGPAVVLISGLALTGTATALLAGISVEGGYLWLGLRLATLGVGLALCLPVALSMLLERVPADQVGIASGLATMSRQFGGALGLAVLATVTGRVAADRFDHSTGLTGLRDLVAGGEVDVVRQLAGTRAASTAGQVFIDGFTVAMWLATAAVAIALLIAVRWAVTGRKPGRQESLPRKGKSL